MELCVVHSVYLIPSVMDSDSSPLTYEDILSSEATLLDVESTDTDSVADLNEYDDDMHVGYDEDTGDLVIRTAPPSNIPDRLPIVTSEQIWAKERTVVVQGDPRELRRIREMGVEDIDSSESSPPGQIYRPVLRAEPDRKSVV